MGTKTLVGTPDPEPQQPPVRVIASDGTTVTLSFGHVTGFYCRAAVASRSTSDAAYTIFKGLAPQ